MTLLSRKSYTRTLHKHHLACMNLTSSTLKHVIALGTTDLDVIHYFCIFQLLQLYKGRSQNIQKVVINQLRLVIIFLQLFSLSFTSVNIRNLCHIPCPLSYWLMF